MHLNRFHVYTRIYLSRRDTPPSTEIDHVDSEPNYLIVPDLEKSDEKGIKRNFVVEF